VQFESIRYGTSQEASVRLLFGGDLAHYLQQPAVDEVEALSSQCDDELGLNWRGYECDDGLGEELGGADVETETVFLRPYSEAVVVVDCY
jgi:hypothetical protein